jgi:methionyl-tRNA synthetase
VEKGFQTIGEQLEAVHLRAALQEAIKLAAEVNKYLDTTGPWFEIKTDKAAAATSIYTALRAIDSLKILLSPFLPFTSERLHNYLGYTEPLFGEQFVETREDALGEHKVLRYRPGKASGRWAPSELPPGQALQQPSPLFKKLEERIVEEERWRLGE